MSPRETLADGGMAGKGADVSGVSVRQIDPYAFLKKFHFSGVIEFRYQDYSTESSFQGHTTRGGWTTFEQAYRLGMEGYIYHPKLAVFSVYGNFDEELSKDKVTSDTTKSKNLEYEFDVTFLPTRPVSLNIFGSRNYSTLTGWQSSESDITSNVYGAMLFVTKKGLPMIRAEYTHWDSVVNYLRGFRIMNDSLFGDGGTPFTLIKKRVEEKTGYDRFSLDVVGRLDSLRTTYRLGGYYLMGSTPLRHYNAESISGNIHTFLNKKRDDVLSTYFQYSKIDVTRLINFGVHVTLSPISHIYQSYNYEYLSSDSEQINSQTSHKTESHTLTALLRYRLSSRIYARAEVQYKLGSDDGKTENSYRLNVSANYRKPVRGFEFFSQYYFSLGKEEKNGAFSFMQHELKFGLTTQKLRWATIYSDYDISYRTMSFNPSMDVNAIGANGSVTGNVLADNTQLSATDIEQKLRIGANGRGPMRLYWNVELEGRYVDSTDGNTMTFESWRSVWFGASQWAQKIRHYTASADVRFPLSGRGSVSMKASYTLGTTNSVNVSRYFYETRLTYRLLRNLNLIAWMREDWKNKGWWAGTLLNVQNNFDWKQTDYEIDLTYAWRRVHFSLEYTVTHTVEGSAISKVTRYYLAISRRF